MKKGILVVLGLAGLIATAAVLTATGGKAHVVSSIHPLVNDYQFMSAGPTPPTQAACAAANASTGGRRCFTPSSIHSAYNLAPLYAQGLNGRGQTIAIIDSYGNDNMAHDLHVFNQAFGLQPMCGEEGVTCASGMPTFSELSIQGSPATKQNGNGGIGLEDKTAWALEVVLDVEWAHAIAPGASILLVHTPTAETLGVQGFPQMMMAEDYVVKNHLATVISQSLASSEEAFNGGTAALENLRYAFKDAAENGVTVLGSSGDGGTANSTKQSLTGAGAGPTPYPTVEWPASDPLVTGVGGTFLCTDPLASDAQPRTVDSVSPPTFGVRPSTGCGEHPGVAEIGWIGSGGGFSHVFSRPSYQNVLPAGSTPIPADQRGVPDIAYNASSRTGVLVYISLPPTGLGSNSSPPDTGWYIIGGTSAGSPQWAGLVAIADQINGGGLGLINPGLYRIGSDPGRYAHDFYDVTTWNNGANPSVPGFPATTGWDPVTGLGTPNAAKLLPDLVSAVNGQ
jgi:subtilase family serine protease